ncbi:DUF4443 domain-containing protein [Fervidicoccus fontis]|jgi:hypothetical protein|uniref:DUF4443 domain-containing protein n=2 Tax=Fervidicoccus fontis TaxID=683846 RepID=I0A1G9_FERFK|nr:DUF4443 domain-containing protein [Fervidicoccus fontis]AFH42826.1 hypothetical protein FFONT_0838 [Fervidicoccus fontis Kam940]MBE9391612.1 DUF4443 domain-containing protein [Fervidicoccus fontis]
MNSSGSSEIHDICSLINTIDEISKNECQVPPDLIFFILYLLSINKSIGRSQISTVFGFSEYYVRRALKCLKDKAYILQTGKIKSLEENLLSVLKSIRIREAFLLRGMNAWERIIIIFIAQSCKRRISLKETVMLRDSAIRWGAEGSIILQYCNMETNIPGIEDLSIRNEIEKEIKKELQKLENGLYIIIGMNYKEREMSVVYGILKTACELSLI